MSNVERVNKALGKVSSVFNYETLLKLVNEDGNEPINREQLRTALRRKKVKTVSAVGGEIRIKGRRVN